MSLYTYLYTYVIVIVIIYILRREAGCQPPTQNPKPVFLTWYQSAMTARIRFRWPMVQVCLFHTLVIRVYPVHLLNCVTSFMFHTSESISFLSTILFVIMTCLLSFTIVFSLLRTKQPGASSFTVEVTGGSIRSPSLVRHLHRLAVPPPVFEFRRRNGINVLVILQIMWSLPLFGVMNFRVLVQIIHR